jgi:hypothetical protein
MFGAASEIEEATGSRVVVGVSDFGGDTVNQTPYRN